MGHTKTPWTPLPDDLVYGPDNHLIADCSALPRSAEECEDNTKFIVHAANCHDDLLVALREIAKGQGAYSRDRLEHATNCIEEMKALAHTAIAKAEAV